MANKDLVDNLNLQQKIEESLKNQKAAQLDINLKRAESVKYAQQVIDREKEFQKFAKENSEILGKSLDRAQNIGDSLEEKIKNLPFLGGFLVDKLGIKNIGEDLQNAVVSVVKGDLSSAVSILSKGGILFAGLTAIFLLVRSIGRQFRDLAGELGTSVKFAKEQFISLKSQELILKAQNLNADNLRGTFKSIVDEFGSLENATAVNAANLERIAQRTGTSATDIVKFNKVMTDLTGVSFDVATNMAQTAISMAESANVSTNKVMSDIAESSALFAEFSRDGANGLAEAAVEAAKVGSSLNSILSAADKLLDFESSITDQFEAQVLTGRMINTERARQLALDGDIAGLTQEIQSIVGGVGDIQQLNVLQRRSIADAIGISVEDLRRISRGEQIQERKSVQDYQKETNEILRAGLKVSEEQLEAAKDKRVSIIQPAF